MIPSITDLIFFIQNNIKYAMDDYDHILLEGSHENLASKICQSILKLKVNDIVLEIIKDWGENLTGDPSADSEDLARSIINQIYILEDLNTMYLEGNQGGDYIQLTKISSDIIHLEVGHCCVQILDAVIPVEALTCLISKGLSEYSGNIIELIKNSGWPEEYILNLIKKIEVK